MANDGAQTGAAGLQVFKRPGHEEARQPADAADFSLYCLAPDE